PCAGRCRSRIGRSAGRAIASAAVRTNIEQLRITFKRGLEPSAIREPPWPAPTGDLRRTMAVAAGLLRHRIRRRRRSAWKSQLRLLAEETVSDPENTVHRSRPDFATASDALRRHEITRLADARGGTLADARAVSIRDHPHDGAARAHRRDQAGRAPN